MLTYKPNIVLSNKEYKVVGTRPIRHDGAEKVTKPITLRFIRWPKFA